MGKTHWRKMFLGKYKDADLIDRKALIKNLGWDTEEKIEEDWNSGLIGEETTDILSAINGAPAIDPVDIVEEYEKACEEDRRNNP